MLLIDRAFRIALLVLAAAVAGLGAAAVLVGALPPAMLALYLAIAGGVAFDAARGWLFLRAHR